MAVDLHTLWNRLPERYEEELTEIVMKAKAGDEVEVCHLAKHLKQGTGIKKDWPLAKELFQWLVEQDHETAEAEVMHLNHLMNPALPYTAMEIQKWLNWCCEQEDDVFLFGLVVQAMQSDDQLFYQFKYQVIKTYKQLLIALDKQDTYLEQWQAVLVLDERMHSGADELRAALSLLSDTISFQTDAYVVITYLECAIRLNQRYQIAVNFSVIDYLRYHGCQEEVAFYSGLASLCEADYAQAYESFCQSEQKRCRLGCVYCLIHGMGTPVDHQQARAILKNYPDDAFALYLLAVSLYRTRTTAEIPVEVTELLEESYAMGYKPADTTRLLMELAYSEQTDRETENTEWMKKLGKKLKRKVFDAEVVGAILFAGCHRLLRIISQIGSDDELADSVSIITENAKRILNIDYGNYSPLAAYMRALCQQTFSGTYRMKDWLKGLNGINQSPQVRAWAVGAALLMPWMYEDEYNHTLLLSYYRRLLGVDMDLPILCTYLSSQSCSKDQKAICELFQGIIRLLQGLTEKTAFAKILIAFFQAFGFVEEKDPAQIRQYLLETAEVKQPFLVKLRNLTIMTSKLDQEISITKPAPDMIETKPEWINHFIGYAFMDYTA